MSEPPIPQTLGQVLAWAREMVMRLRSMRLRVGSHLSLTETPSGTLLELNLPTRPTAKPIAWQAYDLKRAGEAWECKIWPGHVLCIDPKTGEADPMKYWIPTVLEAVPPTPFTVSATKKIYAKVVTSNKDIVTAVTVEVLEDTPEVLHAMPPPSASDNGESPPPPQDGEYYYLIADFEADPDNLSAIRIKPQRHIGGPIYHRPALHEFHNLPAGGADTAYAVMKGWNPVAARFELRPLVQIDVSENNGVPIIKPLGDGEPPYSTIKFRGIRDRATGDDETEASTQIKVKPSTDGKCAIVLGNGKVGMLKLQIGTGDPVDIVGFDDGLLTGNGDVIITIPDPYAVAGHTGDVIIRDCDADPFGDPPFLGTIRMRFRLDNGRVMGVNESEEDVPLSEDVETTYLQSCHWVDDQPHSHPAE